MEQFGKYQMVRRIGSGGMAEVYLARTTVAQGLEKQLVIKKIHPAFARSHQFMAMFVDEARIALGLNHPNVVQVFDFGNHGENFFLAMEYVEGIDLLRLMRETLGHKQRVPFGIATHIIQQLCKGLDYAHRKSDDFGEPLGIVHRDVSPQNVLVSWDGAVKIVDFGIARARTVEEEEGVIKGKFAYMSPEQARGEIVDCRSDVFATGIVLFELICGRPLFPGRGKEVLDKVKAGAIPRPRDLASDLPPALEECILKSLAFHRDDRFQTARDMQHFLTKVQLDIARTEGDLVDSGSLAQWLAQIMPQGRLSPSQLPSSNQPSSQDRTSGDRPAPQHRGSGQPPANVPRAVSPELSSEVSAIRPTPKAAEMRERKHVFVVEGYVRSQSLLERRMGADAAKVLVTDFFSVAKDIAFKHEAHVHAIGTDGLTLVVGMPVSNEDDAPRAIRLGLALVDALDGIGLDVEPELRLAVGIQRGVAVVRRGGEFSYELEAQTTSIARKLAREAQGAEILVGGRVYRMARTEWNFEPLTTIDIPAELDTHPGIWSRGDEETEPGVQRARVYRLRGPKERAERLRERANVDHQIVGRDLELKSLRDIYRDVVVASSKRQVVLLGEAGIGKRAIVSAFLEGIPSEEAIVLRASTRAAMSSTPLAVIADIGRDLLGLAENAAVSEIGKRVERIIPLLYGPGDDPKAAKLVAEVAMMLLGGPVSVEVAGMDATTKRNHILSAMARIEAKLGGVKPLIAVGEDVHWADQESLTLFREILALPSKRPILGIVTARPEPHILAATRDASAHIIELDELDPERRLELITRRFVPGQDSGELARQIVARAGGNPFFINEILDSLIERKVVLADDDDAEHPGLYRWVQREAPLSVPTSVEALLMTRFDILEIAEKEVLMRAAILGRAFSAAEVTVLLDRDATASLDALTERGLLGRGDKLYRFRNDMTMSVAYRLVPQEDRTRLHRLAAKRIAEAPHYRPAHDDGLIARHLELAGDDEAAARKYLEAASLALDIGGNTDAFRQLTRALKLLPDADHATRFAVRKQREEILRRLARRPQQLRELHNLRKDAEALGDLGKQALAHARLAQFYIDVGKAPSASRAVQPALELARKAGDKLAEAEALRLRSSICRLVGNTDEALALCEEALTLVDESREGLDQRAQILNNRGTILWNIGKLEQAIEAFAEALVIYRMLGLPRREARALNNMGIVFAALGEFEEALAHYKSSLKIDQKLGDRSSIALKLGNIGQTYADLGDAQRAESYLAKALKLADQMGDGSSATDAAISLGQVYLGNKDAGRALELFERGLALATENRERYQEIRALIYVALSQLGAGKPAEGALELAVSATELARKMSMSVGAMYGLAVQAQALAALGRNEEAVARSREARTLLDKEQRSEGTEQILHMHAQVLAGAGLNKEATATLERARREVESKLAKIRDPDLRRIYRASPVAVAVLGPPT